MKQIITLIIFIILATSVTTIVGGNTVGLTTINDCVNVTINVTATQVIDEQEYEFVNCIQPVTNYWECACNGDYELVMKVKQNTVNDYTFSINYVYMEYGKDYTVQRRGHRSSGISGVPYWAVNSSANQTVDAVVNVTIEQEPQVNETTWEPTDNVTVVEPVVEPIPEVPNVTTNETGAVISGEPVNPFVIGGMVILLVVLVIAGILLYRWYVLRSYLKED